jgi:hypothetical protein
VLHRHCEGSPVLHRKTTGQEYTGHFCTPLVRLDT